MFALMKMFLLKIKVIPPFIAFVNLRSNLNYVIGWFDERRFAKHHLVNAVSSNIMW